MSEDLISREEALRAIITAGEVEPDLGYTHLHKVIENLPSAKASQNLAEPIKVLKGSDLISRRDAIECCSCLHPEDCWAEIKALPSATSQNLAKPHKTCEDDLIRRQDAIKPFCIAPDGTRIPEVDCDNFPVEFSVEFIKKHLLSLPSAEPKTGVWVLDPNGMDWNIPAWRCSECGFVANYIGVEANGLGNNPMNWAGSKFCPQCGARITGYER